MRIDEQREQEEFGAWLKSERERLRLTRAAVARSAGISEQQLYRIETGETGSRRDTLRAIAQAMRVEEADLLERAGYSTREVRIPAEEPSPEETDPTLTAIEAFYRGSPPELRPAMLGAVASIVREHQRKQTDFGKRSEPVSAEREAEIERLERIKSEAIRAIEAETEQMLRRLSKPPNNNHAEEAV